MAKIRIKKVTKVFGATPVLRDVSLDICDGEFITLVGPSGCGKSTLLRLIAGLEVTSSGHIEIGERDITDLPPKDRDIAMVFQNYALYPSMTARENMAFGLKLRGISKSEVQARTTEAADVLGLGSLLDRYPKQLSGGQRQRVAMGRAIVRKPKAFLFDEPLSNLDAKLRVQMRHEINALQARLGVTTIYVTHDQTEAMTMGDTVVVMNEGGIEQAGKPMDVYNFPENLYVAGFMGTPSINLIEGRVAYDSGSANFVTDAFSQRIDLGESAFCGDRLICGIRPESLSINRNDVGMRGVVSMVETAGPESLIYVDVGGHELRVLYRQHDEICVGQAVTLSWDAERTLYFNPDSTNRILGVQAC